MSDKPRVGAAATRQRTMLGRIAVSLFAAVAPVAVTFSAAAQSSVPGHPPLIIRSLAGRDLFEFYCASCHGRDATGHGPVAAALKHRPPDLTRLAVDHDRIFPRERVEAFVTNGGDVPARAHGTSEMPVWGPIFRGLDPSDAVVKVRIVNVVNYIESIQVKESGVGALLQKAGDVCVDSFASCARSISPTSRVTRSSTRSPSRGGTTPP